MGGSGSTLKGGGPEAAAGGGGGGGGSGGGSGRRFSQRASSLLSPSSPPPPPPPPEISEQQKQLLTDAWKTLEDDIASVGVITFISLFETHPDVQQVFMPFNGIAIEDLKHSKQLRAHALRVMAFVQKAVARLYEPEEKLLTLLQDLGRKHVSYGAKQEYVDLIGPQFIQAIKPSLEAQWSDELQGAWERLFEYIAFHMKAAMEREKAEKRR
ncbi:uncharacterized protein LOC126195185 [Schistocerca nitens]|uniref:uncharacterized protein LOC126195185 n=1 Tax=Schistocerca nitens TaxID=7011 RepID=UPI00211812F2|nr:uncharacterized protein LOC126195185 [Schistocerca nitens]